MNLRTILDCQFACSSSLDRGGTGAGFVAAYASRVTSSSKLKLFRTKIRTWRPADLATRYTQPPITLLQHEMFVSPRRLLAQLMPKTIRMGAPCRGVDGQQGQVGHVILTAPYAMHFHYVKIRNIQVRYTQTGLMHGR